MNQLVIVLSLALASTVQAHHSHYVDFLPDSNMEFRGTIDRVYWSNPHVRWEAISDDGERWQLHVQPSATNASRSGLAEDTFAPGDEVVVSGEVGRDGRNWVYVQHMIDGDGDEYGTAEQASGGVTLAVGADFSSDNPASWCVDPDYVAPYLGEWRLVFQPESRTPALFDVEIIEYEGKYVAQARGGLEDLHVDSNGIKFTLKLRMGNGVPYEGRLAGRLNGDGTFGGVYRASNSDNELAWIAVPADQGPEHDVEWAETPFRLDGAFGGRANRGGASTPLPFRGAFTKRSFALTDAGAAVYARFDPTDAPTPRCQPWGPMQDRTFGINRVEFVHDEESILRMRDEWMARDWFADALPDDLRIVPSANGFGVMTWEEDHLRIDITHLRPGVIGLMHYPYSGNARVVERIWLSADGNTLRQTLMLHDPEYYHFPIVNEIWRSRGDNPLYNVDACDPDPFYIDLYDRGAFGEYVERSALRP